MELLQCFLDRIVPMEIQVCRKAVQQPGDDDEGDQPLWAPPDDEIETGRLAMPQAAMPTLLPFAIPYSMQLLTVAPRPMATMPPFIANQVSKKEAKSSRERHKKTSTKKVYGVCAVRAEG